MIQMLSFRNDLIDTIKPFFEELNNNNNEKYNINEEKHIPFLKSLSQFQLIILCNYNILDTNIYIAVVMGTLIGSIVYKGNPINVREIIQGDKMENMQKLIREKDIKTYIYIYISVPFDINGSILKKIFL